MKEIKEVTKLTDRRFINLFTARYITEKGEKQYDIASRKKVPEIVSGERKPDAVRIIPYYYDKDGEMVVVLIREFRYPINKYIYGVPAGLIDNNENPIESAKRELYEEIGAEVVEIAITEPASYSSAGMSDESLVCLEAEVKLTGTQHLEGGEDIEVIPTKLSNLQKLLDKEDFGLQSRLQLRGFLYRTLLKEKENNV